MNEETREEMFRKYITKEDLLKFQWRILKYMCEVSNIYNTFPETLLFHRTDLKDYIDYKFSKETNHSNGENPPYKLIMDNVMDCLMDRDAVEMVEEYKYGNFNMVLYGQTKKFKDACNEFMKYNEIDDPFLIDRLLPKEI
jgi:hypothetical protein